MSSVRRRKGNRRPDPLQTPIAVIVYGKRIEGTIFDNSDKGLGVMLPQNCGLESMQPVKVVFNRNRRSAKVVRVEQTPDGDRIGLKLLD